MSEPTMCNVSAAQVAEIANLIELKGGLIAKARAAKHLSQVVMDGLSDKLDGSSAGDDSDYVSVRLAGIIDQTVAKEQYPDAFAKREADHA